MKYMFEKAVDLTHELHNGMPIYPGDPAPSFVSYATLEKNGVNLTKLTLGSHTGTHIDAPRHFILNGIGVDQIPASKLTGEAYVADLSSKPIGSGVTGRDLRENLEGNVAEDDIVIIYTGCSEHWGEESIRSPDPVAHKTLLSNGIFIMESLSRATKRFVQKRILMICMPIKLQNGDGAPARIIGVPIVED